MAKAKVKIFKDFEQTWAFLTLYNIMTMLVLWTYKSMHTFYY